jgi:DNA-binding LacI/PurR family transcriptional regulator
VIGMIRPRDARTTVTLVEVAAEAGVSVMTASYAFNRPQRVSARALAKVEQAAATLGYAGPDPSARSLRVGRTNCLGVVLGEHLAYAFEDPQAALFLAGIADVCGERRYAMTILPTTGGPDDAGRIRLAAVDGLILWTTVADDPVLDAVRALRLPAVVHSGPAVDGLGLISIDNRAAAREIASLTFAGAQRPAVLSFPVDHHRLSHISQGLRPSTATYPVTRRRLEGFRDAARRTGHPWATVTVAVCTRNERLGAQEMTARLLRRARPPDAIAAMSDEQAAGAAAALRAAGLRTPDDVALSGWDDSPVAAELGLTTIAQSMRAQGAECARAVLDHNLATVRAPWTLQRRTSTRL